MHAGRQTDRHTDGSTPLPYRDGVKIAWQAKKNTIRLVNEKGI